MKFSRYIRWWWKTPFLRPWGEKSPTLFAGPWVGEFGWELMGWQGFVRALSAHYERVIVSCRKGHEPLYEDFAHEFVAHEIQGRSDGEWADIFNPEEYERIIRAIPRDADHLPPVGLMKERDQHFIRFGTRTPELVTDVLFHPRGRTHGAYRNWTAERWSKLLMIWNERGYRVGCIGRRDATQEIEGQFVDYRDIDLKKTMDLIASTRLVVGPSSGPMHLASLCGTPHLVWTENKNLSRERYERLWNPLGTLVAVFDHHGFDPPPAVVSEWVDCILPRLMRGTPACRAASEDKEPTRRVQGALAGLHTRHRAEAPRATE